MYTHAEREREDELPFILPHFLTNSMSEQQGLASALAQLSPCDLSPLTTPALLAFGQCQKPTPVLFERGSTSIDSSAPMPLMYSCRKDTLSQ